MSKWGKSHDFKINIYKHIRAWPYAIKIAPLVPLSNIEYFWNILRTFVKKFNDDPGFFKNVQIQGLFLGFKNSTQPDYFLLITLLFLLYWLMEIKTDFPIFRSYSYYSNYLHIPPLKTCILRLLGLPKLCGFNTFTGIPARLWKRGSGQWHRCGSCFSSKY